nr:hypothetical protein [Escherichia coli]
MAANADPTSVTADE